jgi:hypothetical protein
MLLQISEQSFALTYQAHQTTLCRVVVLVSLQVTGNLRDTLGDVSHLCFYGTSISGTSSVFGKNGFFLINS